MADETYKTYKTVTVKRANLKGDQLRKGMVFDKDVVAENENMLIKEGYVIKNQYALEKVQQLLERYGIEAVDVRFDEIEEKKVEVRELFKEIIEGKPAKKTEEDKESPQVSEADDEKAEAEILVSYAQALSITDKKEALLIDKLIPDCKRNITDKMALLLEGVRDEEVQSIEEDIRKSMEIINTSVNVPQLLEKVKRVDDSLYFYNYSVALTSYMIGKWMGWDREKREEMFITAMLADIGVLNLPEDKRHRDQWEEEDLNEYYKHVIHSQRLLTQCSFITRDMLEGILHHHEKYDGSGYPRNLRGKRIPLLSRVIFLADLYTYYTISKRYNALHTVNIIQDKHLYEVDLDIFFVLSKRIFDYFSGQAFKNMGDSPVEGEIITFDSGTGNVLFDQSNINVYIRQGDDSVLVIPLSSLCEEDIEFV